MPNVTGDNLTFNIDGVVDNQILVYEASTGVFVAQNSLAADANAAVSGASNTGASGIGVFSAKDGDQLKFKKIVGSGTTSVTESSNVITVSTTAYSLPTTLQTTATNANSFVYRGRNFGDNANVDAYAGVYNNSNYPIHSQTAGFDAKTRFVIGSNDNTDIEVKSAHSLFLSTSTADGHVEVRSANSTVFYTGSSSSTTPALKINSNRSLTVANVFTLPTSDGSAGQVLKTDGSGNITWTSVSTDGVSPAELSANLANYIPKDASSIPNTDIAYDIGSTSKKYLNIYASNFKGTADYAIRIGTSGNSLSYAQLSNYVDKTLNLSDLPSVSTARTNLDVYSKAEIDSSLAGAQLQNAISQINTVGSANTINAATSTSAIRFEAGDGISLNQYAANSTIQIAKSDAITGTFKNMVFDGTYIVAETNQDTITFTSGANISFTPNAGSDSVVIDASLSEASIDKYTKGEVNTHISANVDALRFYKTVEGDTGSTAASNKDDVFNIVGGSGIDTVVTGDTVTITNSAQAMEAFKNVQVPGQQTIIADSTSDTLTFEAGSGITLTTDQSSDKVIISNSGAGAGGASDVFKTVAVTGSNSVVASGDADTLTFTAGANATISASGSVITIDATGGGGAGVKGNTGAAGSDGSDGSDGAKGQKGEVGAAGSTGATGSAGSAGATGATGPNGATGDKGAQGAQGLQGNTGAVGGTGPQGAQGDAGSAGAAGDKGTKGDVGPQGTTGAQGSAGTTGDKGDIGATGNAGPQGNIGNTGPAGADGSNGDKGQKGTTGADSTVVGPQGDKGATGDTGPQGTTGAAGADSTVVGPQGVAGDKGATGAQGLQGSTGAQGPTGADSTVVGPQGPQGNTGPQGAQGDKGATGAAGSNGSNGSNGNDGSKGQKGELGPQGTTGPQGGQGTKGDLGPQGTVGATGPQGAQGTVGATGPTGTKGSKGELGGPTGPTGDKGATGAQGPAGTSGSTGSDGAQGPAGNDGAKGEPGVAGSNGAQGNQGATGAQGPAGADGSDGSAGAAGDKGQKGESGGGGGGSVTRGNTYERLKLNYDNSGSLSSISDTTAGINTATVTSAAGAEIEIEFTGFDYPPVAIMAYGYNHVANKYNFNAISGDWTTRTIDGGGSSGSPTAFGSFSNVDLKVTEGITGASKTFGVSTHAWITFVMAE